MYVRNNAFHPLQTKQLIPQPMLHEKLNFLKQTGFSFIICTRIDTKQKSPVSRFRKLPIVSLGFIFCYMKYVNTAHVYTRIVPEIPPTDSCIVRNIRAYRIHAIKEE